MNNTAPTFARQDNLKFFRTLNSRVNNYFKENNIKKTGNWQLHLKAVILFAVFLTPYFLGSIPLAYIGGKFQITKDFFQII